MPAAPEASPSHLRHQCQGSERFDGFLDFAFFRMARFAHAEQSHGVGDCLGLGGCEERLVEMLGQHLESRVHAGGVERQAIPAVEQLLSLGSLRA